MIIKYLLNVTALRIAKELLICLIYQQKKNKGNKSEKRKKENKSKRKSCLILSGCSLNKFELDV